MLRVIKRTLQGIFLICALSIFNGCSVVSKNDNTNLKYRQQVNYNNFDKKTNQERYNDDRQTIAEETTITEDRTYKQDLTKEFNTISGADRQNLAVKNDNLYAPTLEEVIDGVSAKVVQTQNNAAEITNSLLKSSSKHLNIALVAPTTGKYASIGQTMAESALKTISMSKYKDIATINVYNIGALPVKNWENDAEVQRLVADKNDIVIGSIFPETTEKLISATGTDTYYISFINDTSLAEKYPNLTIMSMDDSYKILSLFEYLKDNKRQFLSLILPATKKGYYISNLAKMLATKNEIMIISIQFYQENNKKSMLTASRGVSKHFTATYMVDENGKFITETYKDNKKKQQLLKQQKVKLDENSISEQKTIEAETDAIYVEGNEGDLSQIVNGLEKSGVLNRNVEIFATAILDTSKPISSNFDSINFIGYNFQSVGNFTNQFKQEFKTEPNYFAYLIYDTLTLLFYASNEGLMLPDVIYNPDGFRGILDEFVFTRSGLVERRFSIYRLQNQILNRIFIPDKYFRLSNIKELRSVVNKK